MIEHQLVRILRKMNKFGVFVIVCGIAISNAHPFNSEENNGRYVRQTQQDLHDSILRQRLRNFPVAQQQFQTHVIDYPGGLYAGFGGRNSPATFQSGIVNSQIDFQQFQPIHSQADIVQATTIPAAPTPAPLLESTSALPIVVDEVKTVEEFDIPAPVTPIRTSSPLKVAVNHQLQSHGQDFVEDAFVPQQHFPVTPVQETEEERLLHEEQAKNAHYTFGTSIDDKINDHAIQRQETRDGLSLTGMYSYSDGFFRRTVHYRADEHGYRVVKEETEPIGNGPQFNPNGTADVTADLHNKHLSYSITANDFVRDRENKTESAVAASTTTTTKPFHKGYFRKNV